MNLKQSLKNRNITSNVFLIILCVFAFSSANAQSWVCTWATAPMNTVENNMPPVSLGNHALRQIVHVSCGGDSIRLKLSNEYSEAPLEIRSVFIADYQDSCNINKKTARFLTFNGKKDVTIKEKSAMTSDAIAYRLSPLQRLSITINYGKVPNEITSHPGSRTTSYIIEGTAKAGTAFAKGARTDHWFNLSSIDVYTKKTIKNIAVLGNSITDGRGSTTNLQNRWTDRMSEALGTEYAVMNLGIGGNCVCQFGLGDPAVQRYDRDILSQTGVTDIIIYEGVNDIGGSRWEPEKKWIKTAEQTVADLIKSFEEMVKKAHTRGIKVWLATITAFDGHYYYTPFHETARQEVNKWIRTQTIADGIIDFDKLTADPQQPSRLKAHFTEDWLHLTPEGYDAMGGYAASIIK
ncbi:MAG: SGNH/GDSL hydrolase family protein [Prevotella sp.]|nr:SGNH/GDSL hydrolase family protein [Candidatus Equicola faecalis]